jgi:hypothetical protein
MGPVQNQNRRRVLTHLLAGVGVVSASLASAALAGAQTSTRPRNPGSGGQRPGGPPSGMAPGGGARPGGPPSGGPPAGGQGPHGTGGSRPGGGQGPRGKK